MACMRKIVPYLLDALQDSPALAHLLTKNTVSFKGGDLNFVKVYDKKISIYDKKSWNVRYA